jgi:hypothetical protein
VRRGYAAGCRPRKVYPRGVQPARRPSTTPKRGRAVKSSAPTVGMLLLPFVAFLAAVVLGAVHKWLGDPLGPRFAGELWDITRNLGIMLVAAGPFIGYVQRANANALAAAQTPPAALQQSRETADGEEGPDHDDNEPRRDRYRR